MKYEKWSLGYWFLKQYVRFANWLIVNKTCVIGKERIPAGKPVIFTPNHQNALSDPMAVLLHTRFQPVWLARADIFGKSKIVDTLLQFMKIIPVYRIRDGKENLDKNNRTFDISIKILKNNSALALFPEAAHSFKRQMLPHKKAVPRIAFMTEEQADHSLDIQIIPTGIFYSHYWKFDRTVIVIFGHPIKVTEYIELYKQNQNAATVALKKEINKALTQLVINIKSKQYYHEFEKIREIYGRFFLKRHSTTYSTLELFRSDQLLVRKLDELEQKEPEVTATLVSDVINYEANLKRHKIKNWLVDDKKWSVSIITGEIFILLFGLPLFIYGFLFNILPFILVDRITRTKIKDESFWSTFFLVLGIIVFPMLYIIEFISVFWIIPGLFLKICFLLSLPFAGKLAFKWYFLFRKAVGRMRLYRLKRFKAARYSQLLQEKKELYDKLNAHLTM